MTAKKKTEDVDTTPTPDEAHEMFKQNEQLTYVVTTEGGLHRSGQLDPLSDAPA